MVEWNSEQESDCESQSPSSTVPADSFVDLGGSLFSKLDAPFSQDMIALGKRAMPRSSQAHRCHSQSQASATTLPKQSSAIRRTHTGSMSLTSVDSSQLDTTATSDKPQQRPTVVRSAVLGSLSSWIAQSEMCETPPFGQGLGHGTAVGKQQQQQQRHSSSSLSQPMPSVRPLPFSCVMPRKPMKNSAIRNAPKWFKYPMSQSQANAKSQHLHSRFDATSASRSSSHSQLPCDSKAPSFSISTGRSDRVFSRKRKREMAEIETEDCDTSNTVKTDTTVSLKTESTAKGGANGSGLYDASASAARYRRLIEGSTNRYDLADAKGLPKLIAAVPLTETDLRFAATAYGSGHRRHRHIGQLESGSAKRRRIAALKSLIPRREHMSFVPRYNQCGVGQMDAGIGVRYVPDTAATSHRLNTTPPAFSPFMDECGDGRIGIGLPIGTPTKLESSTRWKPCDPHKYYYLGSAVKVAVSKKKKKKKKDKMIGSIEKYLVKNASENASDKKKKKKETAEVSVEEENAEEGVEFVDDESENRENAAEESDSSSCFRAPVDSEDETIPLHLLLKDQMDDKSKKSSKKLVKNVFSRTIGSDKEEEDERRLKGGSVETQPKEEIRLTIGERMELKRLEDLMPQCRRCFETDHKTEDCRQTEVRCGYCLKYGHYKRVCPRVRCFQCNQLGHTYRDCQYNPHYQRSDIT